VDHLRARPATQGRAFFDPANGKLGLWRPYDFMVDVGPGVYFLTPFDAGKAPVRLVHGMSGHPREPRDLAPPEGPARRVLRRV